MPKSNNKKEQIVSVALELFAKHGYASTPISLIARSAGVSQGLLYNFFSGKEELLRTMIQMGIQDITDSMQAYQKIQEPLEAIQMHVEETIAIIQQKKEFWRLLHAIRLQGSVLNTVQFQFNQIIARVTKIFEKVFRQLHYPNPELEAVLFLTQIDGLVILYLQDNSIPLKKLARQLINRYRS